MNKSVGFTLIELLIVIVVAAVLLVLATPAFLDTIARARLDTATSSLVGAINLTRSEAIKRARVVTLCPRVEDEDGNLVCGDDGEWAEGWLVLADGVVEPVRIGDPLNDIDVDTEVDSLAFDANGVLIAAAEQGFCLSGKARDVRVVSVSRIGRVATEALEVCP